MKIGFIGTGVIATAMVDGIAGDGHHIWVTERSRANSARLAAQYPNVTIGDSQAIIDSCEVIIVALLHEAARSVLPALSFRPEQTVFSVVVGVPFGEFAELIQPATAEAMFIPYPHIAHGGSPLLVYPVSETLQDIFGGRNRVIPVTSEAMLNDYLAAQAILLPTVNLLQSTSGWCSATN